jgi:ABC-2 type transport system ATP-binding protein
VIAAHRLTKTYGTRTAVDGISFTVEPGRVTGFLGPNGAGKSTTMRMVLGLDRPTSGAALVNGRPYVDSPAPLVEVGALLDAGAVESSQRAQRPACPRCHGRQRAATRGRRARIGRPDRSGPQVRRLVLAGMGQRLASPRRCWPTRPS